ncbi:MAG: helix-turn-helix domain-containing protein [Bacilli bacterium]|nr:helix-turn-helix domain-containing protein [Bacilli bacterium]
MYSLYGGTRKMVSGMDKTTIIGLYNAGVSGRNIAKQLSISRNTVAKHIKKYLEEKQSLADTLDPVAAAMI